MWLHDDTVIPGVFRAIKGAPFVVKLELSKNPPAGRIGGAYVAIAVGDSMRLIKIGCLPPLLGIMMSLSPDLETRSTYRVRSTDLPSFSSARAKVMHSDAPQLCPCMIIRAFCFSSIVRVPS
jgi:hypothetical protein